MAPGLKIKQIGGLLPPTCVSTPPWHLR